MSVELSSYIAMRCTEISATNRYCTAWPSIWGLCFESYAVVNITQQSLV